MKTLKKQFLAILLVFLFGKANAQVIFVIKPYLQFATYTGIRVLWETDKPATSTVLYGIPGWNTKVPNLDQKVSVEGFSHMHEVHLENLKPETKYLYQVITVTQGGDTLKGEVKTFRTALGEDKAFAFTVFGDSQSNPEVWRKISTLAWKERPDFGLLAGDLVDLGYNKANWVDEFFRPSNDFMSRLSLYTVLGNHEHDAAYYYQYMSNPEPEYYYTFPYGNARFFMIDSNRPVTKGSEQYVWLEEQLAKSDGKWNFAVHHHPPYSSDENDFGDTYVEQALPGDPDLKDLIHLYEKYQVDIVFFGHIHTYERTWPIFKDQVSQEKGVIYINTGGAGGGLENPAPTRSWYTRKLRTTHHFSYVSIADDVLEFQAIDENGFLFDTFTMKKRKGDNLVTSPEPPSPRIMNEERVFSNSTEIILRPVFEKQEIRYTLDGSEPSLQSAKYTGPVRLDRSARLKAATFAGGYTSPVIAFDFSKEEMRKAVSENGLVPGLHYRYFTAQAVRGLALDQYNRTQVSEGTATMISPEVVAHRKDYWGLDFTGYIQVKTSGLYTFSGHADDKLRVSVHGKELFSEAGEEYNRSGQILLEAGLHPIRIEYFNERDRSAIELMIEGPGLKRQPVSPFMLKRK